jgi:F-type H+-transporting ATPase subunit delta
MLALVSRESLDSTTETLLAAAANLDDAGLQSLGTELASVGALLRREVTLRRALSDSSVAPDTRSQLIARLIDGKVSPATSRVAQKAVAAEWASGADLATAIARLGRTAMFLRAERAGELDNLEDQIFRFGRLLQAHPELAVVLDDQTGSPQARRQVVERLLGGRAAPLTVELLTALAEDTHGHSFTRGVDQLVEEAAHRQEKAVALVTSAVELDENQQRRLRAGLETLYHRQVVLHVQVDPTLQGGLLVRVGDEVIDGSIAGRIAEIKAKLAG